MSVSFAQNRFVFIIFYYIYCCFCKQFMMQNKNFFSINNQHIIYQGVVEPPILLKIYKLCFSFLIDYIKYFIILLIINYFIYFISIPSYCEILRAGLAKAIGTHIIPRKYYIYLGIYFYPKFFYRYNIYKIELCPSWNA